MNIKFEVWQKNGELSFNFADIKASIENKVKEYEGAVFTEESKTAAKGEIASLRRLKKDVDDSRKEVKKLWMKPYLEFEDQVKQILDLVDKPICLIDGQVKAFEEKRITEKKAAIQATYNEVIGDMAEYLTLDKIYNPKWENATVKMSAIKKELIERIAAAYKDVQTISMMVSEAKGKALDIYKTTLDLSKAIGYINQYEAQKAEIMKKENERREQEEERNRQALRERIRAEERQRIVEEQKIRDDTVQEIKAVCVESAAPLMCDQSITAVYTVVGTPEELQELETALNTLGLYFERKNI